MSIYTHPNSSSTSLSDNDDTMDNPTAPLVVYPTHVSPAEWSSSLHKGQHRRQQQQSDSPATRLPPEILIHALKQLCSTRDLHNALLVSRTWCQCAVELLWYKPSFSDIAGFVHMLQVLYSADQTFSYARFVRRLNFINLAADLTDALFVRLDRCVKLERLSLVNCVEITDDALLHVLPLCKSLVALDLTNITLTTDKSIVALAQSAPKLQGINLGGCRQVTDEGLLALTANCPSLRRIKLSGAVGVTDRSIIPLVKSCPLLLEIDLNHCHRVSDLAIRELWKNLTHLRELRLALCPDITDLAFPSPHGQAEALVVDTNPFPRSNPIPLIIEPLPPLIITRSFEHLRMLDLTSCDQVTDDAIGGIITVAPKLRNLVLSKCTLLTDAAVESICRLGRHLHYLHLGHAVSVTDRSVKSLARSCTRLRYIDLACCNQLTDMSVFELSGLPKLRRIGLVRVTNLTDNAIFALADRHSTLERIHLSYCENITVLGIHFLLQRLMKLTHLSLSGVPAFRRTELQQFCRNPPKEFNTNQRATFCVYSGKGVNDLRKYLADVMETVQGEADTGDNETDYEGDDGEESPTVFTEDEPDREVEPCRPPDVEETRNRFNRRLNGRGRSADAEVRAGLVRADEDPRLRLHRTQARPPSSVARHVHVPAGSNIAASYRAMTVNVTNVVPPALRTNDSLDTIAPTAFGDRTRYRVFGQDPLIEPASPTLPSFHSPYARSNASDVGSVRSAGTNNSNGAGFFKTYQDAAMCSRSATGVITPDLVFAELGHGRGRDMTVPSRPASYSALQTVRSGSRESVGLLDSNQMARSFQPWVISSSNPHIAQPGMQELDRVQVLAGALNSHHRNMSPREGADAGWVVQREASTPIPFLSSSPTTRELQESVHSALGGSSASASRFGGVVEGEEQEGRGRNMRKSFKNTLTAAEYYASSFFKRGSSTSGPGRSGGSSSQGRSERGGGR